MKDILGNIKGIDRVGLAAFTGMFLVLTIFLGGNFLLGSSSPAPEIIASMLFVTVVILATFNLFSLVLYYSLLFFLVTVSVLVSGSVEVAADVSLYFTILYSFTVVNCVVAVIISHQYGLDFWQPFVTHAIAGSLLFSSMIWGVPYFAITVLVFTILIIANILMESKRNLSRQ